jgi:hypothetical protein
MYSIFNLEARWWVDNTKPRPFYLLERELVIIVQEAGWAFGPVWTGVENLAPSGPDRPARSQSLYRRSYRAHTICDKKKVRILKFLTME